MPDTLAVPRATWKAGLRTLEDIDRFYDESGDEISGLEPGRDGKRIVPYKIQDSACGLGNFGLVEASQQSMLAQVTRMRRMASPLCSWAGLPRP